MSPQIDMMKTVHRRPKRADIIDPIHVPTINVRKGKPCREGASPLRQLTIQKRQKLGRNLALLCCAWIAHILHKRMDRLDLLECSIVEACACQFTPS